MVYLPWRVWDMRAVNDGGGHYLWFKDERNDWHELRTYLDGRPPFFRHPDDAPDFAMIIEMIPRAAIEVSAQGFRVRWENRKIAVVEVVRRKP